MGNQLSGIAPSQILSVEHYFSDLSDFEFDCSLGSTRFFKVARAKCREGLCVVKVFAIQDPSLPLKTYQDQLTEIKNRLAGASNVLPFHFSILTDKGSLLIRQFLLSALDQSHSVKVCHGDIKTENVMVTGWNWVLLTDIASFKPAILPEDNPADFNFFFDTSRRRSCYIAPERFLDSRQADQMLSKGVLTAVDPQSKSKDHSLPDMDFVRHQQGNLTPEMDIFSAGCVIAELFNEGNRLFDLSELLSYRNGDFDPSATLSKIEDSNIRELVEQMISKDPKSRLSAAEFMSKYRGIIFPEQFYAFLNKYMSNFAMPPVLTADEKISRIKRDIDQILKELLPTNDVHDISVRDKDGCLVIIVSLLTSCIRSCKYCVSKLTVLELLLKIAQHVSDEIILERLLPYMLFLVNDSLPQVRAQALKILSHCLQLVRSVPRSDANIFPEYVLPSLSWLTQDQEVIVRIAYAENIASLAETALKFLEMAQLDYANQENNEDDDSPIQYQGSYDTELQALHELIQRKVVTLLSDPENIVKQTLLENGITQLCVFFGRQKANDVLLSHMITFLNDKQDWQLRGAFFDSIVGVAAYVGWHSLVMLRPLLEQGLSDTEEFVVSKALNALTCLAELGLLQKPALRELVSEIVPFLCHPNMWIRYGAVGFVAAVARILNVADVHCNLLPLLQPFLKQPVVQVDKEVILVSLLKEPINRSVYDFIVKSQHVISLFDSAGQRPNYHETDEGLIPVFRKLHSQGITEEDEDKLLFLRDVILKLHRAKSSAMEQPENNDEVIKGDLNLKYPATGKVITRRHAELVKTNDGKNDNNTTAKKGGSKNRKTMVEQPGMNSEWHHMFGAMESSSVAMVKARRESVPANTQRPKSPLGKTQSLPLWQQSKNDGTALNGAQSSAPPRSESNSQSKKTSTPGPLEFATQIPLQARYARCKLELRHLVYHKRDHNAADMKEKALLGSVLAEGNKPIQPRIQVSSDYLLLASASDDGSVKLWDLQKLDGRSLINKSRQTHSRQDWKMKALVFCQGSSSIAFASDEGRIDVVRIEHSSQQISNRNVLYLKKVDPKEEGLSILSYATSHGLICGLDLRSSQLAWKLENEPSHGVITTFAVDPCHSWLTVGTSSGMIVCWDLRFQLPITNLSHPRGAQVRRLSTHPTEQSWIVSAVQGNNEVTVSPYAVHALCTSRPDTSPYILTAGSDRRIRLWDLAYPEHSQMVMGAATDVVRNFVLQYKSRLIDGTDVLQEVFCNSRQGSVHEDLPRRGPEHPPVGHHECINDIAFTKLPQNYIISAARDGVIKIWK
ncbi:Phosphoinositide 3-kinase regulatory subunit 4 [Acropora cervicornis]|uniref:non-specific serine/threonine protein kinase n=1 Tax=Acropora cervicornis TaxID=6130 RepID=A0AAD9V099_ACRCE|nr:Phosphoinositide 3-kinase regulatory subunit 4 [Acropora cervicornis]